MKTSRFSDSQIIAILKQAEGGSPAPVLCREYGTSSVTRYLWCARADGVDGEVITSVQFGQSAGRLPMAWMVRACLCNLTIMSERLQKLAQTLAS